MRKLVFATGNAHKLEEVRALLPDYQVAGLREMGITEEIPETSPTAEGNARQKADYVLQKTGLDAFADDTVLEVDALGGAPGVLSARFAGEPPDPESNIDKLLSLLENVDDRRARFRTVIALNFQGDTYLFEGICRGEILRERRGEGGFGYDAVFRPEGYDKSFAEMTPAGKNAISHRGKAVRKLVRFLNENLRI